MIWWPYDVNKNPISATATVTTNSTIVTVTTAADVLLIQEAGALVIGDMPPVEVKRGYLDGSTKRIELVLPWPYPNRTNQACRVYPTDAAVSDEIIKLRSVGSDSINSANFLNTLSTSTANTVTLELENQSNITAVPVGKLNADLNAKRNAMSAIGRDLYATDRQGQALAILGEQPNIKPVPLLDLNFAENEYKVYENGFLVDKTLTEVLTTTRNSTATYDTPFGVASANANVPRITYGSNGENLGLLAEEQRTNVLLWSQDFNENIWQKTNFGIGTLPVVTANYGLAPDGTMTADRIQLSAIGATSDNDQSGLQQITDASSVIGQPVIQSVWLKTTDNTVKTLRFDFNGLSSSLFDSSLITVTGDWKRFVIGLSNQQDLQRRFNLRIRPNFGTSDSADILIWGAQRENNVLFPTSYIPTQSSQVTRVVGIHSAPISQTLSEVSFIIELSEYYGVDPVFFKLGRDVDLFGRGIAVESFFPNVVVRIRGESTINIRSAILGNTFPIKIGVSFNKTKLTLKSSSSGIINIPITNEQYEDVVRFLQRCHFGNSLDINGSESFLGSSATKNFKLYPYALSDADLIDLTKI